MNFSSLQELILETIRRKGPVTFERYMALCLYHPEFGYYMRATGRTGMGGDYFTSPDLHPVFARLIARQADEMWRVMGRPKIFKWVEMGAGRGLFALDFLDWTKHTFPDFHSALEYLVIEPGAERRRQIRARIETAGMVEKVRAHANLEEISPCDGCFFSNELADAFPVHVVTRIEGRLREIYVTEHDGQLGEDPGPLSDSAVAAYVARYAHELEDGHRTEANLHAQAWVVAVAAKLRRGFVMTVDYGDLAERLCTPDRPRGTLLAYRGHNANEDYFSSPGETDLTAHVNFTALIDAGKKAGLEYAGFTTQEKFLLALGEGNQLGDLYDNGQSEAEKLDARLKLKRLISPEGMGNIFKVLVQQRGFPEARLTGLKFSREKL